MNQKPAIFGACATVLTGPGLLFTLDLKLSYGPRRRLHVLDIKHLLPLLAAVPNAVDWLNWLTEFPRCPRPDMLHRPAKTQVSGLDGLGV